MARDLHKSLISYFLQLEKLDAKWKELNETASRPLQALRNQSEQLRYVTNKEVDDVELCRIEHLRSKLIFKILMGIENEVTTILDILTRFNNANQDLKNRLANLENARSKVLRTDQTMVELVKGTPYRPRLDSLLAWALDGYKYYHQLYVKINKCMKSLDYKNEETIDDLTRSFVEDRFERTRIDRIFAVTQFLTKETI